MNYVHWRGKHTAQMSLAFVMPLSKGPESTLHERAAWEREVLGMLVSVHPLQLVAEELARVNLTRSDRLSTHIDEEVTLASVQLAAHRFSSRQEEPMLLVDMEDEAGVYQVLWSGATLKECRRVLARREPVVIRGRVRSDRQGRTIVVGVEVSPRWGLFRGQVAASGFEPPTKGL